jgi:uncharacterized protein YegP (UPF0339 family)
MAKKREPRIEIFGSEGTIIKGDHPQQWYWRLRAANGEVVAHGEGYTSKKDVKRGVRAVVRAVSTLNGGSYDVVEIHEVAE